jgi:hypothetical protein
MSVLELHTEGGETWFTPGSTVSCDASWHLAGEVDRLELRLFWYTEGKGTQDVVVVARRAVERPESSGHGSFRFRFPAGPYSFSGTLITLKWALELVALPGEEAARVDLLVAPTPVEISIQGLREY